MIDPKFTNTDSTVIRDLSNLLFRNPHVSRLTGAAIATLSTRELESLLIPRRIAHLEFLEFVNLEKSLFGARTGETRRF